MEQDHDYTESAAKHSRKTRVVFRGCTKMCLTERCRDGKSRPSCWPILGASAERLSSNRVVCSIWLDGLVLWEQLIINHSLDISSDAQHYLLRTKSSFSNLETTILRSLGPLVLYVIIDNLLFVPGDHLQKRMLFVLFEQ